MASPALIHSPTPYALLPQLAELHVRLGEAEAKVVRLGDDLRRSVPSSAAMGGPAGPLCSSTPARLQLASRYGMAAEAGGGGGSWMGRLSQTWCGSCAPSAPAWQRRASSYGSSSAWQARRAVMEVSRMGDGGDGATCCLV